MERVRDVWDIVACTAEPFCCGSAGILPGCLLVMDATQQIAAVGCPEEVP